MSAQEVKAWVRRNNSIISHRLNNDNEVTTSTENGATGASEKVEKEVKEPAEAEEVEEDEDEDEEEESDEDDDESEDEDMAEEVEAEAQEAAGEGENEGDRIDPSAILPQGAKRQRKQINYATDEAQKVLPPDQQKEAEAESEADPDVTME